MGVEGKRSRPALAALMLVAERAFDLPAVLSGIPGRAVSLQASMGIAL